MMKIIPTCNNELFIENIMHDNFLNISRKIEKKSVPKDGQWLGRGCGQGVKMGLRKRWILEEKTC
jgi:hypothetical protein